MAPRDGWLARQIDKITAQEPSMRMALRFTNGGGRGMTDERLCGWLDCGLPEDHPHHRDRAFFEWHPFEAAPSTDEGEALGLTETKIHAEADRRYELPREGGTYTGNEVLRQRWAFFNGAKWGASEARAPLERDLEIARMYAAGVEGTLEQVRTENRAAEERIQEQEAIAFHTDGVMHIATERIAELEAENARLRGALRPLVAAYDDGVLECPHFDSCPAHRDRVRNVGPCNCGAGEIETAIESARALATPPSSTEGTETCEHVLIGSIYGDEPCVLERGHDGDHRFQRPERAGTKEGGE